MYYVQTTVPFNGAAKQTIMYHVCELLHQNRLFLHAVNHEGRINKEDLFFCRF